MRCVFLIYCQYIANYVSVSAFQWIDNFGMKLVYYHWRVPAPKFQPVITCPQKKANPVPYNL